MRISVQEVEKLIKENKKIINNLREFVYYGEGTGKAKWKVKKTKMLVRIFLITPSFLGKDLLLVIRNIYQKFNFFSNKFATYFIKSKHESKKLKYESTFVVRIKMLEYCANYRMILKYNLLKFFTPKKKKSNKKIEENRKTEVNSKRNNEYDVSKNIEEKIKKHSTTYITSDSKTTSIRIDNYYNSNTLNTYEYIQADMKRRTERFTYSDMLNLRNRISSLFVKYLLRDKSKNTQLPSVFNSYNPYNLLNEYARKYHEFLKYYSSLKPEKQRELVDDIKKLYYISPEYLIILVNKKIEERIISNKIHHYTQEGFINDRIRELSSCFIFMDFESIKSTYNRLKIQEIPPYKYNDTTLKELQLTFCYAIENLLISRGIINRNEDINSILYAICNDILEEEPLFEIRKPIKKINLKEKKDNPAYNNDEKTLIILKKARKQLEKYQKRSLRKL